MSDALPLIFGALGGVKGGAESLNRTAREEADQERKLGYARLLQQFRQQERQEQWKHDEAVMKQGWEREDEKTADEREYEENQSIIKRAQDLTDEERKRKTGKEDAVWLAEEKEKISAKYREPKDTTGELGKAYNDAKAMYGGDEDRARAFLENRYGKAQSDKGDLTEGQRFELLAKLREEYALDPASQGKSGGWFSKDEPPVDFESWMIENRPEEYAAIRGKSAGQRGIVSSAMSDEKPKPADKPEEQYPAPPRDKKQLQVGKKYQTASGRIVEWDGKGFIAAE